MRAGVPPLLQASDRPLPGRFYSTLRQGLSGHQLAAAPALHLVSRYRHRPHPRGSALDREQVLFVEAFLHNTHILRGTFASERERLFGQTAQPAVGWIHSECRVADIPMRPRASPRARASHRGRHRRCNAFSGAVRVLEVASQSARLMRD